MNFASQSSLCFCEALEFPSQAELTNFELHRFKVLRFQSVEMVGLIPLE
jgi:hypothetical protein